MADTILYDIQRVPLGLQPLLGLFGSGTLPSIEPNAKGTLELLQFYGLNQRKVAAVATAVATGVAVTIPNTEISASSWFVLYSLGANFVINALDSAVSLFTNINRGGIGIHHDAVGPIVFAAGPTNRLLTPRPWLAYPLICPPGTLLSAIGEWNGAGNRTITVSAEVGILTP